VQINAGDCVYMQGERVQFDEQVRVKDVELNRLKSLKIELEQELRNSRQTVDRVSRSYGSIVFG